MRRMVSFSLLVPMCGTDHFPIKSKQQRLYVSGDIYQPLSWPHHCWDLRSGAPSAPEPHRDVQDTREYGEDWWRESGCLQFLQNVQPLLFLMDGAGIGRADKIIKDVCTLRNCFWLSPLQSYRSAVKDDHTPFPNVHNNLLGFVYIQRHTLVVVVAPAHQLCWFSLTTNAVVRQASCRLSLCQLTRRC